MILSYKGLKIEIPYDSIQIEDIDIIQALDEHIYLNVKFLIEEGKLSEYINKNVEEETITASMYNEELKRDINLFAGKIDKVHISYENGLHIMELKCVSFTKDFDIKKNSRTFCNLDMTYNRVISKILELYSNKGFKDYATGGKAIGDFLLQYEETDWQFIKRLSTHFNTSVLANAEASSGRFSFGLPKLNYNNEINVDDYEVIQDVHTYNMHRGRNLGNISVDNYKTWNIITDKVLVLGEQITFNGVKCQVIRVNIGVHKEELRIVYTLALLKGINNIYKTNSKIFGMSIPAIVKEVSGNMLRVHFDIDPVYESCSNGKYFTYAIESSSWYCMPERGSKVHIYFPTNYEYQAIAVHAVRTSAPKASSPDNKSFSSTSGSEMSLTPSDMTFAADNGKSVSLTLSQSGDVSLVGKNINFTATENLELGMRNGHGKVPPLRPKNIKLSSKNKIEISKGGSLSIKMEEETSIQGPTIKYIGTVKDPVGPLPPEIENISKDDEKIKNEINNQAKEFQTAKVQEGKSKFGFGAVATVIGAVALAAATVATGGAALAVAAGVGLASMAVGVSSMSEGLQDYSKAQSGDFSKSDNFIRDGLCGGNETLYNIVKYGSVMAAGIAITLLSGGTATSALAKIGADVGLDGAFNLLADYADDGNINNGIGHYLESAAMATSFSGTATGISNKAKNLVDKGIMSCKTFGKVRVGVDLGIEFAGQAAMDGEINVTATLARKYISNRMFLADPVDGVTGSLYIPATDIVIPDIHEEFKIERKYESISDRVGILGRGWTVNIETFVELNEDKAHVLCYDGHLETFNNVEGKWINDKGEASIYTLEFIENHWIFKSYLEKKTYKYDESGKLINIIDRYYNTLSITYIGDSIDTLTTFSNYKLYFTYKDNKIIQIKDDIGRTVQYRYTGDTLTEVVHVDYGITAYTYNEEGYINSITDQNGKTYTKNFFDNEGRVIAQEYPNGDICEISYDDERLENTFYYHQSKRTERVRYSKEGLITHVFYEDGSTEEYIYDKYENKIYEKNRNGFETHRTYNEFGSLLEEIFPNGLKEEYTYDENQNPLTKVDNSGKEIIYTYNENGTLNTEKTKISVGEYTSESYTYDSYGRILTKVDGNENITTYEYEIGDHIGKDPIRVITSSKYEYNYEYDEVGRNTTITTDYGTVEFGYNRLNYVTLIKDGNGNITRKFYDKMGNLIRFVPPNNYERSFDNGEGYEYRYDHMDRLISIKNPLGYINNSIRDSEGNVIKEINPNFYDSYKKDGIGIEYVYDKDNRRIKTMYPDGGIERVFYDSNGNIIKHISPEYYNEEKDDGLGYIYIYDNMNRLSSIINEQGITEKTFKYDLHGNLIKEIDDAGNETLFKYDLLGNLIEKRVPAEKLDLSGENQDKTYKTKYNVTCYSYDKNSKKILERHGTTLVDEEEVCNDYHNIYFSYDKENRLIEVKDKYGAKTRYKYDCLNNKIYESFKINDTTEKIIHYIYDKAGNLIEKKEEIDGKFISKDNEGKTVWAVTKYNYDKNGNITNIITPKGFEIERVYDKIDRVVKQFEKDTKNNILRGYAYSYDKIDNVISLKEYSGHKNLENIELKLERNYRYDSKNRLTHYINPSGNTTRLFYDKNDRIIKEVLPEQYNVDTDDGLGTTYSYDLRGKVVEVKNPLGEVITQNTYDIKGNIKTSLDGENNKVEYTYNLLGQIKDIITPNSKEENKVAQSYKYDGRGNITGIIDGNGNETRYLLDDWGRITKIITPEGGEETYTYDYAGNITSTTDSNGGTIEYLYNSLGQVSQIKDQEGYSE
ncbi:DUF6531 domain-containing protein, partial [Clostridium sp.]|uniref:DUF6531 domain-containing protein n=1 Tax=Clostridium sp. TaxID=1506 RepID=UPI0034647D61